MSIRDLPKVDCHCHVFDPDRFPYNPASPYHPTGQEIATAAQMSSVFAAHGVEHALLVQPNSGYDADNACMLDAIARSDGRWKGIAVVLPDATLEQLAELKAQGIEGIAINLPFYQSGHYAAYGPLFKRVAELDMWLQVQVAGDMLVEVLPLIEASGAKLLFDHCGRPDITAGVEQPGFSALLELGRSGRAVVKLSGYIKFSAMAHPFMDTATYTDALLDAFGTDHCIWGSDWPFLRAQSRVDYGPLLSLFEDLVQNPEDRQKVLWENPLRLFGF